MDESPPPPADDRLARVAPTLEDVARVDPVAHRVHLALAMIFLFTLGCSTAPNGIAFAVLAVYAALRLPRTNACYAPIWRGAWPWIALAWLAWCGLSLAWSENRAQGLDELGAMRNLLVPFLLWPLMGRAPVLIAALLFGVLANNGMQALHALGITDSQQHGADGREGGMLHAIMTGLLCGAAMCWWLSYFVHNRSRRRWGALVLAIVAGGGLILTGSRGPWLAAAIALPLQVFVMFIRRPDRRRVTLAVAGLSIIGGAMVFTVARGFIMDRVDTARAEYRAAVDDEDYTTSVGLRLGLWRWAWDSFRERPLLGHGIGSYGDVMTRQVSYERAAERWPDKTDYMQRDHAHSTYLHLLSGTGIVGGALFLALLVTTSLALWRRPADHALADGALWALLVWIIAAQFDAMHLNGNVFGLLMFIAALGMAPSASSSPEEAA